MYGADAGLIDHARSSATYRWSTSIAQVTGDVPSSATCDACPSSRVQCSRWPNCGRTAESTRSFAIRDAS
eukprot:739928-Prymnesium_polylepis.1